MPVNFDLNDLYAFRALVEYGNFRIAAESICLSQSALSRRIEKLETAVGAKLFDRTTRRVTLTLFGQTFADRCGQLLENVTICCPAAWRRWSATPASCRSR